MRQIGFKINITCKAWYRNLSKRFETRAGLLTLWSGLLNYARVNARETSRDFTATSLIKNVNKVPTTDYTISHHLHQSLLAP